MREGFSPIEKQHHLDHIQADDHAMIDAQTEQLLTQPDLTRTILQNPYEHSATNSSINIRSAILAEPEGAYDVRFQSVNHDEQIEILTRELDETANCSARLVQYIEQHTQELAAISDAVLYARLQEAVFDTTDSVQMEDGYSQRQRRSFRLAIHNIIEQRNALRSYQEQAVTNPRAYLESLYPKETFNNNIVFEQHPLSLIVRLDESNFAKIVKLPKGADVHTFRGVAVSNPNLPEQIQKSLIIINTGTTEDPVVIGEQDSFVQHELRHVLFAKFYSEHNPVAPVQDIPMDARANRKYYEQVARDEIIAYATDTLEPRPMSNLGLTHWQRRVFFEQGRIFTQQMPNEEKEARHEAVRKNELAYKETMRQITTYQWLAHKLYDKQKPHKAEALLHNIPISKAKRLLPYVGYSSMTEAKQAYHDDMHAQTLRLRATLNNIGSVRKRAQSTTVIEKQLLARAKKYATTLSGYMAKEALPELVIIFQSYPEIISREEATGMITNIIDAHSSDVSPDERVEIIQKVDTMRQTLEHDAASDPGLLRAVSSYQRELSRAA